MRTLERGTPVEVARLAKSCAVNWVATIIVRAFQRANGARFDPVSSGLVERRQMLFCFDEFGNVRVGVLPGF